MLGGELGERFLLFQEVQDDLSFEGRCVSLSHGSSLPNPGPILCLNSWVHYRHSIKEVEVPTGLKLVFLPAATPELQPAERFWSLVREAVASQSFGSLDDLQETLVE